MTENEKKKDNVVVEVKCTFDLDMSPEEILREIKRCAEKFREAIRQAVGTDEYEISKVEIESVKVKVEEQNIQRKENLYL